MTTMGSASQPLRAAGEPGRQPVTGAPGRAAAIAGQTGAVRSTAPSGVPPTAFAELPRRGLAALDSVVLAPRAPLPIETRLSHHRLGATVPLRGGEQVPAQEMPLAGYLLARALDGRKVDGADLERLRRADESVRETRALLPHGRGNVRQDIDAGRHESTTRVDAARSSKLGTPSVAARAIWAGAGNCGEHAHLATVVHAGRLHAESNEAVLLLGNVLIDHGWAEAVIPRPLRLSSLWKPDERAIVLDAWKDGPAVFATDSTRTHAQRLGAITVRRIGAAQPELLAQAKEDARRIASEHDPRAFASEPLPRWMQTRAKTVVGSAFMERAIRRLGPQAVTSGMPAPVQVGIMATAIARELMAPPASLDQTAPGHGRVRDAARQAPAVADATRELAKTSMRRATPWLPAFGQGATAGLAVAPGLVRRDTAMGAVPTPDRRPER
jgi:DNA-binding transcriptional regulator YdaS (Cro superfamily)